MKKTKLKVYICIEIILVISGLFIAGYLFKNEYYTLVDWRYSKEIGGKEIFREDSPDGNHAIIISRIGKPSDHHDEDWLNIQMFSHLEGDSHCSDLTEKFYNNEELASYNIEWIDVGAKVTISGDHNRDHVYILPFYVPEEPEPQNNENSAPIQNPS